jgi:hypothetical protein
MYCELLYHVKLGYGGMPQNIQSHCNPVWTAGVYYMFKNLSRKVYELKNIKPMLVNVQEIL